MQLAFGLGEVLARSFLVLSILKSAGALCLVHLGVHSCRHRKLLMTQQQLALAADRTGRIFREGSIAGVNDPKRLLTLGAVLPQFVNPRRETSRCGCCCWA
ncbi:hypothetical protein GCM10027162_47280 [Streptomyces incanus]